LLFTLLALAALLLFGLVLWIGWPWWVGFFAAIGLAGLLLGILAARKILVRRREQMFVHQVIAQDESMQQGLAPKEQDAAKELQARWKEAIDALRRSHLRKQGNPLYVLPWYMVIGESGSGKTTAIQSARLSSPFAEMTRTSGISGTRNCDWWFFEQAILIDTAGRYALPVDEGRDKEEWQNFLTLLAKFRKKEPLNGLVVTVAADHLAQAKPEALQEDGRAIRRRIEELTRVLGARSPVYILVTKCDLDSGRHPVLRPVARSGPQPGHGPYQPKLTCGWGRPGGQAFRAVGDRLRDLRLLLLHKTKDRRRPRPCCSSRKSSAKLRESLAAFVKSAFRKTLTRNHRCSGASFSAREGRKAPPFRIFSAPWG
jgi:type VI secretion system protein ImpL